MNEDENHVITHMEKGLRDLFEEDPTPGILSVILPTLRQSDAERLAYAVESLLRETLGVDVMVEY